MDSLRSLNWYHIGNFILLSITRFYIVWTPWEKMRPVYLRRVLNFAATRWLEVFRYFSSVGNKIC